MSRDAPGRAALMCELQAICGKLGALNRKLHACDEKERPGVEAAILSVRARLREVTDELRRKDD